MGVRVGGRVGPVSASVGGETLFQLVIAVTALAIAVLLLPPAILIFGLRLFVGWVSGRFGGLAGFAGLVLTGAGVVACLWAWPNMYQPIFFDAEVGDVRRYNAKQAAASLIDDGFAVGPIVYPEGTPPELYPSCEPAGTSPAAGEQADKGSTVTILMECPFAPP